MEGETKMEANEQKKFDDADKKLDTQIQMKRKIFMKVSDVDIDDAKKFKDWCDKYVDGKQFLGIKVMMQILGNIEPLIELVVKKLNEHDNRISTLEGKKPKDAKDLVKETM